MIRPYRSRPPSSLGEDAKVWAVVVAGGRGLRFGGHKQFELLAGRPVIEWSVEAARSVAQGVVVVLPEGIALKPGRADMAVCGGSTRSASVRAGLEAVPPDADVVVVHDAVRPLATAELFWTVVEALSVATVDGAVPALAVNETLKRVLGNQILGTVPREGLVTVQTPQAFRAQVLRVAHGGRAEGPDDAMLVEAIGGFVVTVAGEASNLKLTTAPDLALAEVLLRA